MKSVSALGLHMCIYPEGTGTNRSAIEIVSYGAFRLAVETGKSIIPGIIFNTKKVLPNDMPYAVVPHPLRLDSLNLFSVSRDSPASATGTGIRYYE